MRQVGGKIIFISQMGGKKHTEIVSYLRSYIANDLGLFISPLPLTAYTFSCVCALVNIITAHTNPLAKILRVKHNLLFSFLYKLSPIATESAPESGSSQP